MYSSIAHLIFVSLWSNYAWAADSNASQISGGRETSLRGKNEILKLKSVGFQPSSLDMGAMKKPLLDNATMQGAMKKPLLDNATMQNISTVYSNSSLVMMNTLTSAASWCYCEYKCWGYWGQDHRSVHVPGHERYCTSALFKKHQPYTLCVLGFSSIWDCHWQ